MAPTIIGDHPLAKDEQGHLLCRVGTVFPRYNTIVTLPGIHATQRVAFVDVLNEQRRQRGEAPLSEGDQELVWQQSVDLIMEDDAILIRPDPDNMEAAFDADELLQQLISKQRIKFLHVMNLKVRQAIKHRGEYWRISQLPRSSGEMRQMILTSRIGIGGREIYYYDKSAGIRYLTCEEFHRLAKLGDDELRLHLMEIQAYAGRGNRRGLPEVAFFAAEGFAAAEFAGLDFTSMSGEQLREAHETLARKFRLAVRPEFLRDDLNSVQWRSRMFAALIGQRDDRVSEEALLGLSSEFFMQVAWLPGGRFEEGELIFDPVLEEPRRAVDAEPEAWDDKTRGLIFNFIREYGDLDYVNIGRVTASLSRRAPSSGRRDVYVAELQPRAAGEMIRIIRMQKWGVREHLDEGKDLLSAILESEEYTEYIMDRRLGCRQLGMNLPRKMTPWKLHERYTGPRREHQGLLVWSPYFERDYIRGIATDKMPAGRLENDAFALRFARLMGAAAAPNIVVGRLDLQGNVIFDDGDEVVQLDEAEMPTEIAVADHTGTFVDYKTELEHFARDYAKPVNTRVAHLSNPKAFADAYLQGFVERLAGIQQEYLKRKRAFDTLFRHRPRNEAGSFAYRWEQVLVRLSCTDPHQLAAEIQRHITLR